MDKLKEVLKYKFWILLGVGLIVTISGWWMTTSSLAASIKTRKDEIEKAIGLIPTSPQSIPNQSWTNELEGINARQKALVDVVRYDLWARQQARMVWPPNVDDFARKIAYQGEFELVGRELYRTNYPTDVERVWKIARPYNPIDRTGIVLFPQAVMPVRKWGELAPTSKDMWESQEDLWLLEPILEAIREVNGGTESERLDASIHLIERLYLLGGDRSKLGASASSSSPGGNDPSMAGGYTALPAMDNPANSGPKGISADFDPKEEVGDGGDPPWQMTGNSNPGAASMMANVDPSGGGGGGGAADSSYRRYVDDDPALPYKTRAFYLKVTMDHRRVPHLIAELTANGRSDWPIEVLRVHVARINFDETEGGGANPVATGFDVGGGAGFSPTTSAGGFNNGPMPEGATGFGPPGLNEFNPMPGDPMGTTAGQSSGFEAAFADPYLAHVALCGLIYLYNPVEPPQVASPGPAPVSDPVAPAAAETTPTADPAGTTPAASTANPAEAATPPESAPPAATPPTGTPPETPAASPSPPATNPTP